MLREAGCGLGLGVCGMYKTIKINFVRTNNILHRPNVYTFNILQKIINLLCSSCENGMWEEGCPLLRWPGCQQKSLGGT